MTTPQAFPKEFRDDVIAVARRAEAPVCEVAKDVGICESGRHRWLPWAGNEDGRRSGTTVEESPALGELTKRNRLLAHENEVLRRAAVYLGDGRSGSLV